MMRCGLGTTLLGLILLLASANCKDYCEISCNDVKGEHTMCLYKTDEPGPNCTEFEADKSVLSQQTKDEILDMHNKLRSKVAIGGEQQGNPGPQPAAANMMELVWDKELEDIAHRYALQCTYQHDKCRSTADEQPVGQNLGITAGSYEISRHLTGFYDEVKNITPDLRKSFQLVPTPKIGHYTQLVWATTSKIGCALSRFLYNNFVLAGKSEMLVCNYGPAGNFQGEHLYEEGEQCSNCPAGTVCSTKYPGLCSIPKSRSDSPPDAGGDSPPDEGVDSPPDEGGESPPDEGGESPPNEVDDSPPVAEGDTEGESTLEPEGSGNDADTTESSGDSSDANLPDTNTDESSGDSTEKTHPEDKTESLGPKGVNDKEHKHKHKEGQGNRAETAKSGADPSLKQTVLARRKYIFMHALFYLLKLWFCRGFVVMNSVNGM